MRKVFKKKTQDTAVHVPGQSGWTCSPWFLCGDLKTAAGTGSTAAGPSSATAPVSYTLHTGFGENPTFSGAPSLQDTNPYAEAIIAVFLFFNSIVFLCRTKNTCK